MKRQLSPDEIAGAVAPLRVLALALVRDACAADDAVQETLLRALTSPPRRGPTAKAWFSTVLRNVVRKRWRSEVRRRAREALGESGRVPPEPHAQLAKTEQLGALMDALRRLAPEKREVIELRFLDGMLPAAIAARLGCPVETVKTRLKRGLADLRRLLADAQGQSWAPRLAVALSMTRMEVGAPGAGTTFPVPARAGMRTLAALAVLGTCVGICLRALGGADDPVSAPDGRHNTRISDAAPPSGPGLRGVIARGTPATSADGSSRASANGADPKSASALPAPERPDRVASRQEIDGYISQLAELSDYGINTIFSSSPRLDGSAAKACPRAADAVLALIRLGPMAVPSLLAALGDDRKTRISLPAALGMRPIPLSAVAGDLAGSGRTTYTVRVGDVCYMILGQIVGSGELHFVGWHRESRDGRLTQTMTLRSPVLNEERRAETQSTFEGDGSPEEVVFGMLAAGFASGRDLLAARLLYYFPSRAAPLVVERLRASHDRPEFARLIGYVSDFDVPAVQTELMRIFLATDDVVVMDACLTANLLELARSEVRRTVREHLAAPPKEPTSYQFSAQQRLLGKAAALFAEDAELLLTTHGDLLPYRCRTAALEEIGKLQGASAWAVPYLARFLRDETTGWRGYRVGDVRYPTRVCDVAALALAKQLPGTRFALNAGPDELDRQIAALSAEASRRGQR